MGYPSFNPILSKDVQVCSNHVYLGVSLVLIAQEFVEIAGIIMAQQIVRARLVKVLHSVLMRFESHWIWFPILLRNERHTRSSENGKGRCDYSEQGKAPHAATAAHRSYLISTSFGTLSKVSSLASEDKVGSPATR
jgi:hypothetical protein